MSNLREKEVVSLALTQAEAFERYIQNLRVVRNLSKPHFQPDEAPGDVIAQIQGDAVRCHELMQENNDLLRTFVYDRDPASLTEEDIAHLEQFAGKLFNYSNSEDTGVAYKIHQLLLAAARSRGDTPMIVKELYHTGVNLHYLNIRDEFTGVNLLGDRVQACFREAAEYMDQYEQLDKTTRQYIIRCVGNTRLGMSRRSYEDVRRYLERFDDAMGIIESPYYHQLDPEFPWDSYAYSMHMDRMTLLSHLRLEEDPEVAQKVLESAEYIWTHQKNYKDQESRLQNWRVSYFYYAARYHAGVGSLDDVLDVFLDVEKNADCHDYSAEGINRNLMAVAYLFLYVKQLDAAGLKRYGAVVEQARRHAFRYLDEMPGSQYPRVASYATWELSMMSTAAKETETRRMLGSILAGHKQTYVHSLMVAKLTRALIRLQIKMKPETLVGLLDCKDAAEVRARKDELCQTAYECGLYHDIGKSAVVMYIDNNARRLLDEEFLCIQSHPFIGSSLLKRMGYDKTLAPAALYHHCFYNGQGGYPGGEGPCPQYIKGIVNALSVADSLDAATDNIGRCYNAAKPFRKLLEELRAQSGTRYAPSVVDLFQDESVCAAVDEELDTERKKVYLQVYHVDDDRPLSKQ